MTTAKNRAHGPEAVIPRGSGPRPWLKPEDAEGWTVIERGKSRRRRVAVSVMIDFDADQSAWLGAEAARTGLEYDELVKQAIDAVRGKGPA